MHKSDIKHEEHLENKYILDIEEYEQQCSIHYIFSLNAIILNPMLHFKNQQGRKQNLSSLTKLK